jgi:hypothetical protein
MPTFQPYWGKPAVRNDRGGSRRRRHHAKPGPRIGPTQLRGAAGNGLPYRDHRHRSPHPLMPRGCHFSLAGGRQSANLSRIEPMGTHETAEAHHVLGGAAAIRRSGTASRGVRDAVTQRRSRDATDVTNREALFVGTARPEPYLSGRSGVDWRKSDAFYFSLEPFDHPVWLCERGYGASRTPAARCCSSQSGRHRRRPRFGFCLRATWAADPLPGRTVQSLQ